MDRLTKRDRKRLVLQTKRDSQTNVTRKKRHADKKRLADRKRQITKMRRQKYRKRQENRKEETETPRVKSQA